MHPVHGVERREGGRVSVLWARGVSFSWWSRLGAEEGERGENWILKRGHQVALLCCQRSGPNLQSTEKAALTVSVGKKKKHTEKCPVWWILDFVSPISWIQNSFKSYISVIYIWLAMLAATTSILLLFDPLLWSRLTLLGRLSISDLSKAFRRGRWCR